MKRIVFAIAASLFVFASQAQAEETIAPVDAICGHLATHAENYEESDAAACTTELGAILNQIPAEAVQPLVDCILSHSPISEEQAAACFEKILGGE